MVFDLRPYGFKNTILSDDLTDITINLPHWSAIHRAYKKQMDPKLIIEYFSLPITDENGLDSYPIYVWGPKNRRRGIR